MPSPQGTAVELRTDPGAVFLRTHASNMTAARNEAEYLRLMLQREVTPAGQFELKPFALIVEDQPDTAGAYREAMRLSGIRALAVGTGREALPHAAELLPDLIVLDYRLPDIHGRELCRRVRDNPETTHIPILVVTASPQDDTGPSCPDAVLTKPCLLTTLLAASRLLLRRTLPAPSRRPAAPAA